MNDAPIINSISPNEADASIGYQYDIDATDVDNDNLIVDQRCRHVLECLDQYQWDPNPNLMKEKPKHDAYSHMADALRYALYTFETSSTTF